MWWVNELWFKRYIHSFSLYLFSEYYSKMHPISCTNTHHDVTDLLNHGIVKTTKTWIFLRKGHDITFQWNKKIINLCLRWLIMRSYFFVAEVTFKSESKLLTYLQCVRIIYMNADTYPHNTHTTTHMYECTCIQKF